MATFEMVNSIHRLMRAFRFLAPAFFLLMCSSSFAQGGNATVDSTHVVKAIDKFVQAFTDLNWSEFTHCFADEATAFFPPSAKFPYRANNKTEIENIFKKVFENARRQRSSPPYLDIQPRDIKIQLVDSVAIVTFLLDDPDLIGRRTIVLRKDKTNWLIVHLHASGVIAAR